MDAQSTFLKVAYLQGLERAVAEHGTPEDQQMIKEAFLSSLIGSGASAAAGLVGRQAARPLWGAVKGIGRMVGRGAQRAGGAISRGAQQAGGATTAAIPGALHAAGRETWRLGKNIAGFGLNKKQNLSHIFRGLTAGGRNLPANLLQYGGAAGAIGGLSGGPDEGWSWSRAGKGFLGGAAGGLGWHAGGRAVRAGLGKAFGATKGAKNLTGIAARAQRVAGLGKGRGMWAERVYHNPSRPGFRSLWHQAKGGPNTSVLRGLGGTAKDMGLKAALGVPAVAGAFGGMMGAEDLAGRIMSSKNPHMYANAARQISPRQYTPY